MPTSFNSQSDSFIQVDHPELSELLYIDLFCGAGGTSTGVERARIGGKKCARVIACVNHDPNAIKSHAANHPKTKHFTEDIRTLDTKPLQTITDKERAKNPGAKVVLWASLECTNFSKAKGGQPRDADSRTLAEHLFRYIDALQPDYIYIENVEEFMCWGDLDENGKPISRDEGRLYLKWVSNVEKRGYKFDHRLLNAADYGARTSRTRFFGIFSRLNLPVVWPEPTHCKGGRAADMFHTALKPWEPVRDVLELDNEGQSIFDRKKPLTERTLERIYAGLIKFVAGGKDAFIVKYNSFSKNGKYVAPGIDEPCPVVATQNRLGVAKVQFLSKQFSGEPESKNVSIDDPSFTLVARMDKTPPYLITTKKGELAVVIYKDDTEAMIRIKEFMAMFGIVDIKMRMLNVPELKRIMGFGTDYTLVGTQTEQKKFIGNAVEVNMSRVLCEALAQEVNNNK